MNYISMYLAIQMIRAKEFREEIKEMYERMHERLTLLIRKKTVKPSEQPEYLNSIKLEIKNKNYLKLLHAQFLMDEEMVSSIALGLREKNLDYRL